MSPETGYLERAAELGGLAGFVYDPAADRLVWSSSAFARLHGLEPAAFAARITTLDERLALLHPADREPYRQALQALIAAGRPYRIAYRLGEGRRHLREDGERLDGGPLLLAAVCDVTAERVELEAARGRARAARAAEARLLGAAEAVASGIAIFDAEGRLTFFNRLYRELMAPSVRPVLRLGERFEDMLAAALALGPVFHPEMGERFVDDRLAWHRAEHADHEMRLADGRWLHVRESALPDGGRVILTTDVTDRKTIEAALRESEARLAAFMEHAPVGMQLKDTAGRFVLVNPEFCRITGAPPEQILGRTVAEAFPEDDAATLEAIER